MSSERTSEQLQAETFDGVLVEVDLRAELLELLAQDAVALLQDLQLPHLEVLALTDHLLSLRRHLPRYSIYRIIRSYTVQHEIFSSVQYTPVISDPIPNPYRIGECVYRSAVPRCHIQYKYKYKYKWKIEIQLQ